MVSKKSDKGIKTKKFGTSLKYRFKRRFKSKDLILVEFTFKNGTVDHYIITRDHHKFKLFGNTYIIDEQQKVWNNGSKLFMFRYHEGYALPYYNKVTGDTLIAESGRTLPEISTSFNPNVLTGVLKMEYVKGVIQGGELIETVKRIMFVGIITLIIVAVQLVVTAQTQGWVNF